MVFAFGLVLMAYVGTREDGKPVPWFIKSLATLAVLISGYCLFDVINQASQVSQSISDAQREIQKLQTPP